MPGVGSPPEVISVFDQLVDRVSATLWNLEPGAAVYLGKHEYDGVVPDIEDGAVEGHLDRLRILRRQLFELDGLTPDQELDRLQLGTAIDRALFSEDVLRERARLPMRTVYHLDIDTYLRRDYAPKPLRVEAIADLLEQAPRLLDQARRVLGPPIPRVYAEWGIRAAAGLAEAFEVDLPRDVAGSGDRRAEARALEAGEEAARALRGFAGWMQDELVSAGDESFAIGGHQMEEMLRISELVDIPLSELLARGEADLAANKEAFVETAAAIDPALEPREVYSRHVESVHATADQLIPATRDMLEGIRTFLIDRDLITIPSEVRARVAETPRHMRWAFAMMDTPGPYETKATEAYYYVTPVEAEWSAEQAETWLRTLNHFALTDISIHEAYPGHYVHFLHFAGAPTEVSQRIDSYAFTEGWAHYTEQMMWEEGFSGGDPRFRLAQLTEALVRNCRYVCAIRMHADGMSVDQATRFFVQNAFYDELPARREAERGTFDPGYFSYTLGKMQILQLREDYKAAKGSDFRLKDFHDRLLSRGAPPVELMRRVLLPG